MKTIAALALAAMAATLSAPAAAQFAKTEDAIKYRQGALFVIGQHFGRQILGGGFIRRGTENNNSIRRSHREPRISEKRHYSTQGKGINETGQDLARI